MPCMFRMLVLPGLGIQLRFRCAQRIFVIIFISYVHVHPTTRSIDHHIIVEGQDQDGPSASRSITATLVVGGAKRKGSPFRAHTRETLPVGLRFQQSLTNGK